MKEIKAYRGLNGNIFQSQKEALDADEKWIDALLVDELAKMFSDASGKDIWTLVARRRKDLLLLFEKYDEMKREALSDS